MDVIKLRRGFRLKEKKPTRAEKPLAQVEYFSDEYVFWLEDQVIEMMEKDGK